VLHLTTHVLFSQAAQSGTKRHKATQTPGEIPNFALRIQHDASFMGVDFSQAAENQSVAAERWVKNR
jgi:hypothetical protein